MKPQNFNVQRTILAMLPPVVACIVQWSFWSAFQPFVWFLFYPAVFLSAWIGGLIPGLFSTFISTGIVWWLFMPPQFSFSLPTPMALVSIGTFCIMGGLFSFTLGRMKELIKRSDEANDTLRASEERYRLLVDGVKDVANIMLDVSGHVITWNQGAERLKGYTAEEIIGRHYSIFYPSDAVASGKPMAELVQVREQGRVEDEGWRVRKDGSQFWAYVVITPLYNDKGEIQGFSKITRDISERKAAQDQLRVSEENLSVTLDSIGDGVMATDAAGRVTRLNAVAERLTGWSQTEAAGRPVDEIFRIINQETRLPATIPVIATLAHGTIQGLANHNVLIARDGSECAIADSCAPIRNRDGQVIGAVLVFRDVTKEYAAQAALRDSAAQIETILNTVVDAIISIDDHGIVETINPAGERIFGYPAAEVIGQNISMLMPEPYRGAHDGYLARYRASGEARIIGFGREVVGRRQDGSTFPVELAVNEIRVDHKRKFVGIVRDITERKTGERAARYLRDAVQAIPDGFAIYDPDDRLVLCNQHYLDLYRLGEVQGKSFVDILRFCLARGDFPAAVGREEHWLMERLRMHQHPGLPFDQALPDGRWLRILETRMSDGSIAGLRSDITALKQAQEAAEVANRAKTDFLANMSHEIRSPLNAILGLAYLLERARLDQDARAMVRKIRASGRMLLSLISDILDMSKIEAGQMTIEQAPFRLGDVMDNVAVALGLAVGEKDIELIIQPLPTGVASIVGDALRLEQVLINLSSNAAKFTQTGRIEVRTELLNRTDAPSMLRFCVQDTGIGIAPELQSEVFSAFAQADATTTRRFGGTGLGLTICRQLVSLMGGEIGVISSPGQGSEFWFTLPLQHAADAALSSPEMTHLEHLEVLIADDSDIALQALGAIAQGLGWQVSAVDSGAAVLAQVLDRKGGKLPSVVVLDWQMPGMDGLATARAIREGVPQEKCPIVIMVTAYSLSTLASQAGVELVDAILQKPVTASGLYNAVMEAQRRRAATVGVLPASLQMATDGLAGVRVLVVDDSDINRDVAQHILAGHGATVSLAVDGQDAIDWLLAHPSEVDLVLMDVQMPVLDGIEATRRLRRLPQFNDLPIVALTAGAFKSQQDAAIEAGMTHFVSKPFDVPSTIALIQRLRRPSTLANAMAPVSAVVTPASTPVSTPVVAPTADLAVMDVAQGMKIWSDVGVYRSYLRRFCDGYSHAADVMNMSLTNGDRPAAAALAHKLSGVAANLALPDTRRLAAEAERVLRSDGDPTLTLNRLSDALAAAVAEIERFAPPAPLANDVPSTNGSSVLSHEQQAGLKMLLIELLAALDTDNPTPAKNLLAELEKQLPQQALAGIWACVRGFDFRGAEASTFRLASEHGIPLKE